MRTGVRIFAIGCNGMRSLGQCENATRVRVALTDSVSTKCYPIPQTKAKPPSVGSRKPD